MLSPLLLWNFSLMVRPTGFEPVLLALACALDDPLPYTFQSDGTSPSSDVFSFRCFWNLDAATGLYVLPRSILYELRTHIHRIRGVLTESPQRDCLLPPLRIQESPQASSDWLWPFCIIALALAAGLEPAMAYWATPAFEAG